MTAGTGMRSEMTFNFGTKVHDRLDTKNYIVLKSGRGDWYVCIDRKLTQYKLNAVRIQIGWVKEDTPYKDPPRASKCDYKHSKKGVDLKEPYTKRKIIDRRKPSNINPDGTSKYIRGVDAKPKEAEA